MEFDTTRWAVYFAVGPFALGAFFLVRSRYLKLLALIATLIFLEAVLLSWRSFYFVGFSLSSALSYAFLGSMALSPAVRSRMPAFTIAWAAFLFFAFVGVLIGSFVPRAGLGTNLILFQMYYLEGLFYFWIGRGALRDSAEAHKTLVWLVIFGGAVAILHLFTLVTGYRFYSSAGQVFGEYSKVAFRYGAVFVNPNTLADFYAMVIPCGIVLSLGWIRPGRLAMPAILASLSLMGVSLLLTASRGGLAATFLVGGLAVLLLPLGMRRLVGLTALSVLVGSLATALIFLVFPEVLDQVLTRFADEGVATNRFQVWVETLRMLASHPAGIGLHPNGYLQAMQRSGIQLASPHNIYLGIAASTGVLGLIAFLAIVRGCLKKILFARRFGDKTLRTVATACLVLLFGFLVGGLSEPIFRNGFKLQHLFWLLAGIGSFLPAWVSAHSASLRGEGQALGPDPLVSDAGGSPFRPQRTEFP